MTSAIIILIILLIILFWPRISRALREAIHRWMARRMENFIRNAAGMPPREEKETKRGQRRQRQDQRQRSRTYGMKTDGPIIPREYAEDVEFTETVSYSSDREVAPDSPRPDDIREEPQVSDAEWEEIR